MWTRVLQKVSKCQVVDHDDNKIEKNGGRDQ
jgi:hypothetical protein